MDGVVGTYPTSEPFIVDEPIDRLMPMQAYLGARWQAPDSPYWLEGLFSAAANADRLSTRDIADTDRIPPGGTPGYVILTLRGGWTIGDSLQLSLALENLFDEDYRIHGSGLNEPGRNIVVSLFWSG
jgi:hemoglobin/transferrin/lactoferrin receptor protein